MTTTPNNHVPPIQLWTGVFEGIVDAGESFGEYIDDVAIAPLRSLGETIYKSPAFLFAACLGFDCSTPAIALATLQLSTCTASGSKNPSFECCLATDAVDTTNQFSVRATTLGLANDITSGDIQEIKDACKQTYREHFDQSQSLAKDPLDRANPNRSTKWTKNMSDTNGYVLNCPHLTCRTNTNLQEAIKSCDAMPRCNAINFRPSDGETCYKTCFTPLMYAPTSAGWDGWDMYGKIGPSWMGEHHTGQCQNDQGQTPKHDVTEGMDHKSCIVWALGTPNVTAYEWSESEDDSKSKMHARCVQTRENSGEAKDEGLSCTDVIAKHGAPAINIATVPMLPYHLSQTEIDLKFRQCVQPGKSPYDNMKACGYLDSSERTLCKIFHPNGKSGVDGAVTKGDGKGGHTCVKL